MAALALLSLAAGVKAWGDLGHETVAYIAQNFVQDATATWAQNILDDTSDSYLANVATWADSYRYTTAGSYSAPFHFIDAEDSPPSSCNVNYERDCGSGGCVVSALMNYTQRVQEPDQLPASEVNNALRFIIHFVGDITQPLHDENYELGGNDIDVTFNGDSTNLHATWDTNMPEQLRGGYSLSVASAWADNLTSEINNGMYENQKASWIEGLNVNEVQTTTMNWATDANAFVCSVVMPNGASPLKKGDLYPTYYNSVIGTIELQIAKAGYRLAKWLDAIAAQSSSKRSVSAPYKRSEPIDLSGRSFLPPAIELSPAKLRRLAVGWGCKHKH